METHFELYSSTVDAAMQALGALCVHGYAARRTVLRSRSLEWILVCVRQWRDSRSLQVSALICLNNVLVNEDSSIRHAISLGVLQELLYTMHHFQEDSAILHRALQLLSTLIASSKDVLHMSATEGALQRLVHALRYFPSKIDVVTSAARAAVLFCADEQCRDAFVLAGGLGAILKAVEQIMKREREVGSLMHKRATANCVATLAMVTTESSSRSVMCQLRHVALIISVVAHYNQDDVIAEGVSELFRNISLEDTPLTSKNRIFLKSRLSVAVVQHIVNTQIRLLATMPENARVAEHACATLYNMCSQGRTRMVTECCENLPALAKRVVEHHPFQDAIVNLAVSLVMLVR